MEKKVKGNIIVNPLNITAKAWAVLNANSGEFINGYHEHERREIASLTKIMTAYTSIQIINSLDINITESMVETSFDASLMGGTTARLDEGDLLNIHDMLHAMMLPSGNDAAYALAEYFGLLLLELGFKGSSDPIQVFLKEMNKNAKTLGMNDTTYANPHGLQNFYNKSTAYDLAKLSNAAMKLPLLAEIVKKVKYSCYGQDILGRTKSFEWSNTNKLLSKGFRGLKTGITPTAGPCLASSYKDSDNNLIIILLSSKSSDLKWTETIKLKNYCIQSTNIKVDTNQQEKSKLRITKKNEDIKGWPALDRKSVV